MNNKDIKNKIKNQAIAEMPDVLDKINLQEITIEAVNEKTRKNIWRTYINPRLIFTGLMLIVAGIIGFNIFNNQSITEIPLETDYEVLAFETITSATLLEYTETEDLTTVYNNEIIELSDNQANDVEKYLNEIKPLIELSELFINDQEKISYETLSSDLEDYQYLIKFKASDLTETIIQYKVYYNQTDSNIEGMIVLGENNYRFSKDNESFKTYKNDTDYIETAINTESNTQIFNYRMFKNNQLQFFTNMELIKQENQFSARFSFNNNKGLNISLEMRRMNQNQFDVDYNIIDQSKNMRGRFNVDVETENSDSTYRFHFPDNSQACENRGRGRNPNCE